MDDVGPRPDELEDSDDIDYDLAALTMRKLHSHKQGQPFSDILVRCHWYDGIEGDRRFWSKINNQGEYVQWGTERGDMPKTYEEEEEEENGGA